jgi:hypothetical protein
LLQLSVALIKACEIATPAKRETMETLDIKLQAKHYTKNMLHISNCLSNFKTKSPHDRLTGINWLQQINGLGVGHILWPNYACTYICHLCQ